MVLKCHLSKQSEQHFVQWPPCPPALSCYPGNSNKQGETQSLLRQEIQKHCIQSIVNVPSH